MTLNLVRFALFAVFMIFMTIQMGSVIAVSHKMWPEDLNALLLKLLGVYSVHLSVILAGIFAQARHKRLRLSPNTAWSALTVAVLWNLLLAWRTVTFSLAAEDSASEVVTYLDRLATASSFLVAGMLAFFFMKAADSASAPPQLPKSARGTAARPSSGLSSL
jgi:hypothetical protein